MTPSRAELFSLEGRTVLCTGATRGIGAQMAIALAEAGAGIFVQARMCDGCIDQSQTAAIPESLLTTTQSVI
jgi:NAD(P)-dependent dehydrogenase (short-subunit alcohol dehydrogenase family)